MFAFFYICTQDYLNKYSATLLAEWIKKKIPVFGMSKISEIS